MLDLSQQQKAAVHYVKGPLLLLGEAGSGKTSLLAHKIAWLIREYDTAPASILAVSANAHAARLLRARVADCIGHQIPNLAVKTFRELGLAIVQQRLDALGLLPGFSLYDRTDSEAVIGRLLRDLRPPIASLAPAVARQIAYWKRHAMPPPSTDDLAASSPAHTAAWLFRLYEQRLRMANAIDLDDLARKAGDLLALDASLLTQWRGEIGFLLVDEYERTSTAEHQLTRRLAADQTVLTAAGDENQLLADAASNNLARLRAELPEIRVIRLEHNFRSSPRIARAAATLATPRRPAAGMPLKHADELGRRIRVVRARNEQQEADAIVSAIQDCRRRQGTEYRDFAVLVARPDQTIPLEHALKGQRIPYYIRNGASFFDQLEVRDLWSYLRLICNPADDTAFLRAVNTPRRDIDRSTLQQLLRYATDRGMPLLECALDPQFARSLAPERFEPLRDVAHLLRSFETRATNADPVQLANDLVEALHYEAWLRDTCNDVKIAQDRMQNVAAFIGRIRRLARQDPGADLRSLMGRIALVAHFEAEEQDTASDSVALLSFDDAKGCEFTHVCLVGFEEGLLPGPDPERALLIEHRRAYMAIACAKETLTFTIAEHRRYIGDLSPRQPSRFLADLVADDLEWIHLSEETGRVETLLKLTARPETHLRQGYR